jgi:flagellar hook-associated protein 2
VLTSTKTGAANKITLSAVSTDGLDQLSYNPPTDSTHFTVVNAAQDASIKVAGFTIASSSNVVTNAIEGVTLTLKTPSPGTGEKLDISANTAAAASRIKNFVSQYNAAYSQIFALGKYDSATGKAGPLVGDALVRSVTSDMRRAASDAVGDLNGSVTALANIGITTSNDGTLQVDDVKLNAALSTNFDGVGKLFGSANGIAARMSTNIGARLTATGDIAVRNQVLDKRTKAVAAQQSALDAQMAKIESTYRAQFTALDVALSKMQSTSNYLTQQLAKLP